MTASAPPFIVGDMRPEFCAQRLCTNAEISGAIRPRHVLANLHGIRDGFHNVFTRNMVPRRRMD
jgi:hypothetical protein